MRDIGREEIIEDMEVSVQAWLPQGRPQGAPRRPHAGIGNVAGADAAEEVEVAEGEGSLAEEGGRADGGVGEVGGAVRLDGETLR